MEKKDKTPTKEVIATIDDLSPNSLKELVEKAAAIFRRYKSEEITHAFIGLSHAVEMAEKELGKFIIEVEKIESIKEAQSKN